MNKIRFIFLLGVALSSVQCEEPFLNVEDSPCLKDPELSKHFSNWLSIISVNYANKSVDFSDLSLAYDNIQRLTGIKSRAQIGNDTYVYYSSEDEYLVDLNNWLSWYKENKCTLKMSEYLNELRKSQIEFPDYKDKSIAKYLHVRYPNLPLKDAIEADSLSRIKFSKGIPNFIRVFE